MNGILFLNKQDFGIKKADKGNLLAFQFESRGLTLVLFYSVECQYCDVYLRSFKQMPLLMSGCRFAMLNISKNMEVVRLSQNTVAAITYVPDVILYVDGLPYMRYDGPPHIQKIQSFITDIYQKLQHKNQFVPPRSSSGANAPPPPVPSSVAAPPHPPMPGAPMMAPTFRPPAGMPPSSSGTPGAGAEAARKEATTIPAYSLGLPVSGQGDRASKRCYLNYGAAYGPSPSSSS